MNSDIFSVNTNINDAFTAQTQRTKHYPVPRTQKCPEDTKSQKLYKSRLGAETENK